MIKKAAYLGHILNRAATGTAMQINDGIVYWREGMRTVQDEAELKHSFIGVIVIFRHGYGAADYSLAIKLARHDWSCAWGDFYRIARVRSPPAVRTGYSGSGASPPSIARKIARSWSRVIEIP
ncbi:hypothetical protein GCM10007385_40400 [Tateyamaria omphalii]|nr:hypothetical protein GCM10007385_40400 [Tateyamaria omphalii]